MNGERGRSSVAPRREGFYVQVDGAQLKVWDSGGDLPAILTLHGAPGMSDHRNDWDVYQAFVGRFRVVSYDQRGSGESSDSPPFDHQRLAADADALRRELGLGDRIVIAGGSYGGYLAQEYALRYPQHVWAVVLRDTTSHNGFKHVARQKAVATLPDVDPADLDRLFEGRTTSDDDFRDLIRKIMPLYTTTADPERDRKAVDAMAIHHATHNWAFARNQLDFDLRPRLGELAMPVLITVGRHDWITPLDASEELHSLIPDSELVVFEHSGHGPQNEERELWRAKVADFLQRKVLT